MARTRTRIQHEDLLNGSLVRSSKTGFVYQLGEPKKRNVNKNVVNHCQLLNKKTGAVIGTGWYNMTNLRDMGFKFYGTAPKKVGGGLPLERGADAPEAGKEQAGA